MRSVCIFLYPGLAVSFLQLQEDNFVNYSPQEIQIVSSIKRFYELNHFDHNSVPADF